MRFSSPLLFGLLLVLLVSSAFGLRLPLGKLHAKPTYRNYNRLAKRFGAQPLNGVSGPVGGNVWPVAIYWFNVEVGSPPITVPVAIDTGSSTMAMIGPDCGSMCVSTPPNVVYQPGQSSTSSPVPCDSACANFDGTSGCTNKQCAFSDSYQTCNLRDPEEGCTITGVWFYDHVSIGGVPPVKIAFGAINNQTANFNQFQTIDAIVGLVQFLSNDPTDVFLSLVEAGSFKQNVFAMCLLMAPGPGGSNGTITFGEIDPTLYTGEMLWTPNVGGGFYSMQLNSIYVLGQNLTQISSDNLILDSGTNVLLLPDAQFQVLKQAFLNGCKQGVKMHGVCDVPQNQTLFDGVCFDMTPEQVAAFPTITVNVQNIPILMAPSTYLNTNDPENPLYYQYCLGIRDTGDLGGSLFIMGDTSMSGYYVAFDNDQNRIGWAPVNEKTCGAEPLPNLRKRTDRLFNRIARQ